MTVHSNVNSGILLHNNPSEMEERKSNALGDNRCVQSDIPDMSGKTQCGDDKSGHEKYHISSDRHMFATVTVSVCYCGAGCLLDDIVGEWLVYGIDIKIRGRMLWAEFLIGALPRVLYFGMDKLTKMHRMCLRTDLRCVLPVLLDRADVRQLRDQDSIWCSKGGHPIIYVIRNGFVWLDDYFPDRQFVIFN